MPDQSHLSSIRLFWTARDLFCRFGFSIREAKDEVIAWLPWYNRARMHPTLGYTSPAESEQLWQQEQLKAVT